MIYLTPQGISWYKQYSPELACQFWGWKYLNWEFRPRKKYLKFSSLKVYTSVALNFHLLKVTITRKEAPVLSMNFLEVKCQFNVVLQLQHILHRLLPQKIQGQIAGIHENSIFWKQKSVNWNSLFQYSRAKYEPNLVLKIVKMVIFKVL